MKSLLSHAEENKFHDKKMPEVFRGREWYLIFTPL